jgi:DNA-nicking Smr family endonuclease
MPEARHTAEASRGILAYGIPLTHCLVYSLLNMSLAEIRSTLREALGILPTLDLHGLGVKDALAETERFLREAQLQGINSLRIVYGKGRGSPDGRGVLREVVPRWLDGQGHPLIRRYERRPDATGSDGAVIVWVRPLEPAVDEGV